MVRQLRWFVLAGLAASLLVAGCSNEDNVVAVVDDPGDDPPAANRPADPGLSYEPGCLGALPLNNTLRSSLPPDFIPSIEQPRFFTVEEAGYLRGGDRVFGIELAGRFYAFPRKILNWHEIVTFTLKDDDMSLTTSATWCPLTFSFIEWRMTGYDAPFDRSRTLGVSGSLLDNNLVMFDRRTRTTWSQILGLGLAGPDEGECMAMGRNAVDTTWDLWRRLHPETVVLTNKPGKEPSNLYDLNPYDDYWASRPGPPESVANADGRLGPQEVVLGVHGKSGSAAVRLGTTKVAQAVVGETPALFFHHPATNTTYVFENDVEGEAPLFVAVGDDEAGLPLYADNKTGTIWTLDGVAVEGPLEGKRLGQLPAYHIYWFAWATFFPDRPILDL